MLDGILEGYPKKKKDLFVSISERFRLSPKCLPLLVDGDYQLQSLFCYK